MRPLRYWLVILCWSAFALAAVGCGTEPASDAADVVLDAAADVGAETAADAPDAEATLNLHLRPGFLAIAHRGGGKQAPEATSAAYQNALQLGVDVIECDVHSSADGVLVCIHDATVDRTTDGKGKVHELSFSQLRALDAGYRFTQDGGQTFPFRGKGVQIPTLQEFLSQSPTIGLSIEIKQPEPPIAPEVIAAIRAANAVDRTVLISFVDQTMLDVRALAPDITTGLALGEMLAFAGLDAQTEASYTPPARVLQASYSQFDPAEIVARAHRLGMKVQFWTVNDPADMASLLAVGADGIFTDDPASLMDLLAAP